MLQNDKSILVIGAGAIGGISAAFISKAGYNVEIVCKYEDYRDTIVNKGLKVNGVKGEFIQKLDAYPSVKDVAGKKDIILLAVKATDLEEVAEDIRPLLKRDSLVVSMQNGICEPELARIIGNDHVVGCIVGWGATMDTQAEMVMTSEGDFVIGYIDRPIDNRITEVEKLLNSILPVRLTDNMMGHLYSKLIINSCITSLGAITGMLLGEMMMNGKTRKLFIAIIREAMELAEVMQIRVEDYGGRLNYYEFLSDNKSMAELRRQLLLFIMGLKYRRLKSSSLQSLERGKLTEIDYLNGFISANSREYGIPSPLNDSIVEMIHEIEDGKRDITPVNLNEGVFKKYYK